MLTSILRVSQLVLAVLLVIVVLLQQQGAGMGAGFGGTGGIETTRRGIEKTLYNITIIVSILFFLVSLLVVII